MVPLRWAPTVFAVIALFIQLLPPLLLISRRFDDVWPHLPSRLVFAAAFIGFPNSFEEFGNITNSQWYLGVLAFLIVSGAVPRTPTGRVFDAAGLILSGLSGPFCIMLAPVAGWLWFRQRSFDAGARFICVAGTAAIQLAMLVLTVRTGRPRSDLGASWNRLAHILVVKIEFGLVLGARITSRLVRSTNLVRRSGRRSAGGCRRGGSARRALARAIAVSTVRALWRPHHGRLAGKPPSPRPDSRPGPCWHRRPQASAISCSRCSFSRPPSCHWLLIRGHGCHGSAFSFASGRDAASSATGFARPCGTTTSWRRQRLSRRRPLEPGWPFRSTRQERARWC